jgi:hypothetical protein
MRIRGEEWRRAEGFPYRPPWTLPVLVIALVVVAFLIGFLPAFLLGHAYR